MRRRRQRANRCAQRRRERDAPAPAAREQVDGRREERKQTRHEHELDRPSPDQPRAEVEVAGRALGELEALVERAEQVLRGAADLVEPVHAQPLRDVADGIRRIVLRGGEGERADSVREERRLLVERVREAEVGELLQDRIPRGAAADLRGDARRRRLEERSGRVAGSIAVDLHADRARPADGVQIDHRCDVVAQRRVGCERGCAQRAEGASVGRDEQDRVVRAQCPAGVAGRCTVRSRQLHEHRRARGVVVGPEPGAVIVAVRHDDDRARGAPDRLGDEVLHLHAAVARDDGAEALRVDRQPVGPELFAEPVRGADRPGKAVRVERDEVVGELLRSLSVELREERTRQRRGSRDGERGNEQRQSDEQPCPPVETPVDRPLHRAWTCPAPLGPGRNGGHAGL